MRAERTSLFGVLRAQAPFAELTHAGLGQQIYELRGSARWGEPPHEAMVVAGGKGALEGRVTRSSSHHRVPPAAGVPDENVAGRVKDFLIPGTWATAANGLPDITLTEALYRSYRNYIAAYCQSYPGRLKSMILVPGGNVEWAVKEVKRLRNETWVAAVWPLLPEAKPIDHPDLAPLWDEMNDAYLPIVFHSFFYEPPYFPGYRDIWGNAVVARTAAHPWGAARLLSYLIVGQIFDKCPNINAGVAEVGHGWLPHWVIRLGEMIRYCLGRDTTAQIRADQVRADGPLPLRRRALRGSRDDQGGDRHSRTRRTDAPIGLPARRGAFPGHCPDGPRLADLEGARPRHAEAGYGRQCGAVSPHDVGNPNRI
jgi:hypothetical protein